MSEGCDRPQTLPTNLWSKPLKFSALRGLSIAGSTELWTVVGQRAGGETGMSRVSLLVKTKTRDPGASSPDRDCNQTADGANIYSCVIPNQN